MLMLMLRLLDGCLESIRSVGSFDMNNSTCTLFDIRVMIDCGGISSFRRVWEMTHSCCVARLESVVSRTGLEQVG